MITVRTVIKNGKYYNQYLKTFGIFKKKTKWCALSASMFNGDPTGWTTIEKAVDDVHNFANHINEPIHYIGEIDQEMC